MLETPNVLCSTIYANTRLLIVLFPPLSPVVVFRGTCVAMGIPNYCDVIEKPMNLTYIKDKVDNLEYENLAKFFADVDLMIDNALKFNNEEDNPYHVAALEMKAEFVEFSKKVVRAVRQRHQEKAQRK